DCAFCSVRSHAEKKRYVEPAPESLKLSAGRIPGRPFGGVGKVLEAYADAFDLRRPNDGSRRDPAVGPGVGEGRLSRALQTFIITTYALARRLRTSWIEARVTEGGQGLGKLLEVLGETPVASEPGKGALEHPAARQDDKALH